MTQPRLIVGLGNPDKEYASTRHNIGFMAADAIAAHYKCPAWKRKFKGLLTSPASGPDFLLLKPMTFMNLSGQSVGEAMRFHKLEPKDVIVFHDELDLQPGQVKIKQGGGAAGHNGLKSLDEHIGQDYWRVRLGIGHPGQRGDIVSDYVLSPFAKSDKTWLEPLLDVVASGFESLLSGETSDYLSHIAKAMQGKI
ncbi:MAG: aminoacyl-tRNA hydrolase [Alphaproteobacteria bacterium]|nr:aminoacyl-tRNA hydrolase [Alphaproteobacteria bacterium]